MQQEIFVEAEPKKDVLFKLVKTLGAQRQNPQFFCDLLINFNIYIGCSDDKCQVRDAIRGKIIMSLKGHNDFISCISFNHQYDQMSNASDRVATGSSDETARIWNITSRKCQVLVGHSNWIIQISFDPKSQFVATGSLDSTARLWEVKTGKQIFIFSGHNREVVSLQFDPYGDKLLTGSLDFTARIWDVKSGDCLHILADHIGEVRRAKFNFNGDYCATGSNDNTCKIWDVTSGKCIQTFIEQNDYILDFCFNLAGTRLITTSSKAGRVYNLYTKDCILQLLQDGGIQKVQYFGQKNKILTLCFDEKARIYSETGECLQNFDETCDYSFNQEEDILMTSAYDNVCKVWKQINQ